MLKVSRLLTGRFLAVAASTCVVASSVAQVSVRSVRVLGTKDIVEVEVQASDRIVPETQVLSGPDRLVVDFPNAVPGAQLRNQSIDRADVKNLRVGLFQSKPPVTRIVLDLKSARSYQIFPNGRTVMIKVTGDASQSSEVPATVHYEPAPGRPGLIAANYTAGAELVTAAPQTPLQVSYREGLLGIHSNKATLSEVLYAIQQRTGADISIPAGAEQEIVVADIPPAPAAEALAKLLNGSRFNFLILNSANDPRQLDRVILSARSEGGFATPLPPVQEPEPDMTVEEAPVPSPVQPVQGPNPENAPPPAPPAQPADNGPDQ
jgi:AMIN domain